MKILKSLIALCFSLLCVGCQHKELLYNAVCTSDIVVRFIWKETSGVDIRSMYLYCYPIDGGHPYIFDLAGKEGGVISLPEGTYEFIAYNSDTETVRARKEDKSTSLCLYTHPSELMGGGYIGSLPDASLLPKTDIKMAPEKIFLGSRQDKVRAGEENTIEMTPKRIGYTIHVSLQNIDHPERIDATRMLLFNVYSTYAPNETQRSEASSVAIPFDAFLRDVSERSRSDKPERKALKGEVNVMDYEKDVEMKLFLYLLLKDGIWHRVDIGITPDMITKDPNGVDVYINDENVLKVPELKSNQGGMQVTVDDYDEVNQDVDA